MDREEALRSLADPIESFMQYQGEVPGRPGDVVTSVQLSLPSPGQRGIIQGLLERKSGLASMRPLLHKVQNSSRLINKKAKKDVSESELVRKVKKQLGFLRRLVSSGLAKHAEASANDGATTSSKLDVQKDLTRINEGVQRLENGVNKVLEAHERRMKQFANRVERAVKENENLASELKRQIETLQRMGATWMRTKWNKDALTAVGRGPPGNIAFSPFSAHDPPFERDEVVRVVTESARRSHHSGAAPTIPKKRR